MTTLTFYLLLNPSPRAAIVLIDTHTHTHPLTLRLSDTISTIFIQPPRGRLFLPLLLLVCGTGERVCGKLAHVDCYIEPVQCVCVCCGQDRVPRSAGCFVLDLQKIAVIK